MNNSLDFLSQQLSEFHAEGKFLTGTTKKSHKLTVAEIRKVGPFAKDAAIDVGLYVPPVPPSDLEFCGIIHLRYFLHIIVHVSGLYACSVKRNGEMGACQLQ